MPEPVVLISCEHASNHVPTAYRHLFAGCEEVLASHRGFDPGAADCAGRFGSVLGAPVFLARVTRLLVDHNRSPHHPVLWSSFSHTLSARAKATLLDDFYHPFRNQVAAWVDEQVVAGQQVLHLAIHTFTPNLDGRVRRADIGLLYDPGRSAEAEFCRLWQLSLRSRLPGLRILRNSPYRGRSDCHQNSLRRSYPANAYLAIELEINQRLLADETLWQQVTRGLAESFGRVRAGRDNVI